MSRVFYFFNFSPGAGIHADGRMELSQPQLLSTDTGIFHAMLHPPVDLRENLL